MRQLATIQKVSDIREIPDADKIVMARILGYETVVKKDEFKVGDLIVYIECDSIVPERQEFEFLREGKFRIKIRKFRKQIREGLVMPLSILPYDCIVEEGKEVTDIIGVKNYVRASEEEEEASLGASIANDKKRSKFMRFLMDFYVFRKVYLYFNSNIKGNFPTELGISKTDETRVQTCARILMEHYNEEWYLSEKIDGQSGTFFTYWAKVWARRIKKFGVCSRNLWIKTKNNSNYWRMADKYDLEKKMQEYIDPITIQCELAGPAIQGNKYKLEEMDIFVFNVFQNGEMASLEGMERVCAELGLKTVPIINRSFIPSKEIGEGKEVKDVVDFMVKLSQGDSCLLKRKREGVVCRLKRDPKISFKVINPYFLLESEEKQKIKKENEENKNE